MLKLNQLLYPCVVFQCLGKLQQALKIKLQLPANNLLELKKMKVGRFMWFKEALIFILKKLISIRDEAADMEGAGRRGQSLVELSIKRH